MAGPINGGKIEITPEMLDDPDHPVWDNFTHAMCAKCSQQGRGGFPDHPEYPIGVCCWCLGPSQTGMLCIPDALPGRDVKCGGVHPKGEA